MKFLWWIALALVAVLLILFAVSNRETVSVELWPLPALMQLPLYLLVLGTLVVGFFLGEAGGLDRRLALASRGAPLARAHRQVGARARRRAHDAPAGRRAAAMSVAAKICGLSSEAAVEAAIAGGAAYVGFVFYPPSPRSVSPERAGELCAGVPAGVQRVGLFVDAEDAAIAAVLDAAPLDILQFHGAETSERVADAKRRFGRAVMKAISVAGSDDAAAASRYEDAADLLLFDAKPPRRADALPGGNGLAFDWRLIAGREWRLPWMLSGGLTAALLPEAVRVSGARAVDVSSGVESAPGQKDIAKIRDFLAAAASCREHFDAEDAEVTQRSRRRRT